MASRRRRRILVINPNSNEIVTKGLDEALGADPLRRTGPRSSAGRWPRARIGIETQEHVESVTLPLAPAGGAAATTSMPS